MYASRERGGGFGRGGVLSFMRDGEHKTAVAKWRAHDPGVAWMRVLTCVSLPPILFALFFVSTLAIEVITEMTASINITAPDIPAESEQLALIVDEREMESVLKRRVNKLVEHFVAQTDYKDVIDTIWSEFPQEMNNSLPKPLDTDSEEFLRDKIAAAQYRLCEATLWLMVEKQKLSRPSAVAAEPICGQLKEMMKIMNFWNVVKNGTEALTTQQMETLNAAMARTMTDVFKTAYQDDILHSEERRIAQSRVAQLETPFTEGDQEPPSSGGRDTPDDGHRSEVGYSTQDLMSLAQEMQQERKAALHREAAEMELIKKASSPPTPPGIQAMLEHDTCALAHTTKLEKVMRLRFCQFESSVRSPTGASLLEALAASVLQVQSLAPPPPPQSQGGAWTKLKDKLAQSQCAIHLVGTQDLRFPLFLEKTLVAVGLERCKLAVYEHHPARFQALQAQAEPDENGKRALANTRLRLQDITSATGSYKVQLPGAATNLDPAHSADQAVMRDSLGNQQLITSVGFHVEKVPRRSLDDVLCEPLKVTQPDNATLDVAFCEVGEVPLVTIAAHQDPITVLSSFPRMLKESFPGAIIWEVPYTADVTSQVNLFKGSTYSVHVAMMPPPNTVAGHVEPRLVRLDSDNFAVETLQGLVKYHSLNITLIAVRAEHNYLLHARNGLIVCENPCGGGPTLSKMTLEVLNGVPGSCPDVEICQCTAPIMGSTNQVGRKLAGELDFGCVMVSATWRDIMKKMYRTGGNVRKDRKKGKKARQ